MNASTGVRTFRESVTAGGATAFTGCNDHSPFSAAVNTAVACAPLPASTRGSGTPIATHFSKSATCSAVSRCSALGGIFSFGSA